jgi:cholesterol oxidase
VLDGGILPAATGVNPSHTIAAVAERNIETVIRRVTSKADWRAPEAAKAKPVIDPLSQLTIAPEGVMAPTAHPITISFTETMKGFIDKGHRPPDDYVGADKNGQRHNSYVEFTLTITFPDLDKFLVDPTHAGVPVGRLRVDGFTGPDGSPVTSGVFNLFVNTDQFYERKMLYALQFYGADGKPYLLDGFKEVKDHGRFDVWGATSTL